ncbi:hypothetical protein TWF788_004567 [Orbilia oligospora]|uniref:Protein artemis n=1 Tax=Orbilia oligospora TaxID=2813651 RepID=A0A7C8KAD3_ORBOL|nr:hypothetical protein TWF788_004567 [Orbilia oligospora]KAF3222927.1 hypothetical protein TWF679_004128 [Orbilia oligospora]
MQSTFNGIVKGMHMARVSQISTLELTERSEFSGIQFDYFRKVDGAEPSLANFLSHIHSDHLTGLAGKSYRAPFIYCSAATKQLLLKLERRLHRFNYAKKLVESHEYSYLHYANRDRILRELPLETPTDIELCPGYTIRVTLFDANHCPGSTMFLVEGGGKAILYTGDIRAEPWWLEKLKRNPILLPYFRGIKTLDCLYLDTTHASFEASHLTFNSKADGIADLLTQISKYPSETVFHLNTWTLGYEDAWVALASYFNTQIHLDDYRLGLFNALGSRDSKSIWEHGAFLLGRTLSLADTVLTDDKNVRFHSCERWLECEGRDKAKREGRLVEISPLVARYRDSNGTEYMLREPGEGGGNVDANAVNEMSGDLLLELAAIVKDQKLSELIQQIDVKPGFILPLDAAAPESDTKLDGFIEIIKRNLEALILSRKGEQLKTESQPRGKEASALPTWFGYPASRHSSFSELQDFVKALAPKDVYPCVAADGSCYQKDSIRKLFGKYCKGTEFVFDVERALDIDFVAETRHNLEYLELQEQRAAGMAEESQQARSQQVFHSSQEEYLAHIRGPTQSDDSEIKKQVDDAVRRIKLDEQSHATCLPGDTQADEYDPTDPNIVAKVERAIEDGKLLSKSILNVSPRATIQVHRTPETSEIQEPEDIQKAPAISRRRQTKAGTDIILTVSLDEYKRATVPLKRFHSDSTHSPSPKKKQSIRKVGYDDIATADDMVSEVPSERVSDTFEEKDGSQDSLPSNIGDLDRERVKEAMKAVREGRWLETSSRLGFNNMNWKYKKEKEL